MHFCVMSNYDLEVLSFHLSLPPCVCLPAVHLSAYPCEVCVPISACAAVLTCAWSLCASVCLPSSLLWWWLSSESWWIKYDLSSYGSLPFSQLPSLLWLCSFLSIKAWTSQFLYLTSNSDSFTLLFFSGEKKKFQHLSFIKFCDITIPSFASFKQLMVCVVLADRATAYLQQIPWSRSQGCLLTCVWEGGLYLPGVQSISLLSTFPFAAVPVRTQWFLSWFPMCLSWWLLLCSIFLCIYWPLEYWLGKKCQLCSFSVRSPAFWISLSF